MCRPYYSKVTLVSINVFKINLIIMNSNERHVLLKYRVSHTGITCSIPIEQTPLIPHLGKVKIKGKESSLITHTVLEEHT